jgi:leucyl aminopeptidase
MKLHYKQEKVKGLVKPATVIFITSDPDKVESNRELEPFSDLYLPLLASQAFKVGKEQILPLYQGQDSWLLLVGPKDMTVSGFLEATAAATEKILDLGVKEATFIVPSFPLEHDQVLESMALGLTLALEHRLNYKLRPEDQSRKLKNIVFLDDDRKIGLKAAQECLDRAQTVAKAQLRARALVDRPANLLYPELLAQEAKSLSDTFGLTATIWDEKRLAREGAGAILAVGSGSSHPPRIVILEYQGPGVKAKERPTALVGKGITFDSGGLCLKPPENMSQMKTDMAGAAAVLSTICAASELKMPISLVAVLPLAENLPSGSAFRPGDIVNSLSNQSIEIMNTDAEGRLILADALTLAQNYKPYQIIDLATLTGACLVALGESCAGLFSNNGQLASQIFQAGLSTAEDLWPMPLFEAYDEKLKSDLADFKESATRAGGAIIGALFLKRFIKDDLPWAHLDIVGTARNSKKKASCPEGATGFGVRTLLKLLSPVSKAT